MSHSQGRRQKNFQGGRPNEKKGQNIAKKTENSTVICTMYVNPGERGHDLLPCRCTWSFIMSQVLIKHLVGQVV